VWLFDVDGTLLHTDGLARKAFAATLRDQLGIDDDLRDIAFAGRTDPLILGDILRKHGRSLDGAEMGRFWAATHDGMSRLLSPGTGRLLPGVPELLGAVGCEPAWVAALLTGNTTGMARVKLGHFGIGGRFEFGAFGEEAADRNALACVAVARAAERYGVPPHRCIVIGDTEHDVACARASGARAVAVATGIRSREVLEATRPDLMLADLSDAARILDWAREVAAGD
jgi:phosphoglycolate phosphatase-like HAD superfamily hydrolase